MLVITEGKGGLPRPIEPDLEHQGLRGPIRDYGELFSY